MSDVPGTKGYESVVDIFAEASLKLKFEEINSDFLDYLPLKPARILDAGCGVGQNAATFARWGYSVVAVEPLREFVDIAKDKFSEHGVIWVQDSLPHLGKIDSSIEPFDFILMDGVWHHLSNDERRICIKRLAEVLSIGGVCAISLRNGPAGVGKHVFATDTKELHDLSDEFGFDVVYAIENQPSKMKYKPHVVWSRVVIRKTS